MREGLLIVPPEYLVLPEVDIAVVTTPLTFVHERLFMAGVADTEQDRVTACPVVTEYVL